MLWTSVLVRSLIFATIPVYGFDVLEDPCSAHGNYELITSRGVVELAVNETATCVRTCPELHKIVPQIECLGGDLDSCKSSSPIVSAVCIYQDVFSMEYHSCVFLNATGHVVPVARYSFELEHEPSHKECVLKNSYRVWYNQDFVRQKALLVILGISLGCAALVLIILMTLCFFYCCRRKPRDEPLLNSSDMNRTVY